MKDMVSIIIVNYNVADLLINCIQSVYTYCTKVNFEIIVVDNSSTDNSAEMVRSRFPDIRWIQNHHNSGFPAANNQGIKAAKGCYFFLLNPDTELLDDSISILKEKLDANPKVNLVAPQLLNSDRSIQSSLFRFPTIPYILAEDFYLKSLAKSKYYAEKDLNKSFDVESASGAALFFRRELIVQIGTLNEKLFWIEDVDFCYRIQNAGGTVRYIPETKIIHHSGQSAKKNFNVSICNQVINKIKFFKLYKSPFQLAIVYLISIVNVFLKSIVFGLLSPFKKMYRLKFNAYLYTIPRIFSATSGR